MKVEIKLEQDDVDLLGRYLCQDWSKNQGDSEDIFGSTFWKAIDNYLNGRPVRWSHTPSIEADNLMHYIMEAYELAYPNTRINFYWEE